MGHTNTKKMVQGAMIAAIFGALSLLNTYTGSMFDIFICYVMVIPLVWYGFNYSLKENFIVCITSMIVIALVGLPFFVISSISSCLCGMYIGECLRKKTKKETIIVGTFVVTMLNNILLYEVFAKLLDINLIREITEMYQGLIQVMPSLSNQISLDTALSFIPIVLIIMSMLEMYAIILLCQLALSRLKVEFPGSFHISMMHLKRSTGIIIAILMFGSYLIQRFMNIDSIYLTYVLTLCTMIFALQGVAFLSYYLIMKDKVRWMVLVFIGVLIPMLSSAYVVFGIMDIFSDLRENILYNRNNDN